MADRGRLVGILQKYLPTGTEDYAADLLLKHSIHLYIKKPRTSKFGDYRAPRPGENHRISVNKDLNPYAFLVTFLHEVAHLLNYEKHRTRVKPHGPEWKLHFRTQAGYGEPQAKMHEPPLLFHLGRDASERFDVAAEHPEVVAELKAAAEAHRATMVIAPTQLK